jgi:4-hydroxy-tetrahydrodipicolinate synthase
LSGEDGTAVPASREKGHGCISVTANVAPGLCVEIQRAWRRGDLATTMALQDRLMPLHVALFCETNPAPVKYAASLLGRCLPETRLPLAPLSEASKETVRRAMTTAGLIN